MKVKVDTNIKSIGVDTEGEIRESIGTYGVDYKIGVDSVVFVILSGSYDDVMCALDRLYDHAFID